MAKLFIPIRETEDLLISGFKKTLQDNDKVVTRKTIDSLRVQSIQTANLIEFNVYANKSLGYIQRGRRAGAKPPPPQPIKEWIKARRIQFTSPNGRAMSLESMAFLISRSIGKKGIKPTDIIGQAELQFKPKIDKLFAQATKQFINETIFNSAQ